MKTYQWLIVSGMVLFVTTVCFVLGLAVSYTYMIPKTYPETIVLTREVIVERQVPFEVVKTVEVEVIKEVVVTPVPPVVEAAMPIVDLS